MAGPPAPFWPLVTRLGEAQILLPALLAVSIWLLLRARAPGTVMRWLTAVGIAAAVTGVTKVAFLGFGIGHAGLDFTGVSGHAMSAAAMMPLLAHAVSAGHSRRWRVGALAAAALLAAVVGVSRVMVHTHSPSEVAAGLALGGLASGLALARSPLPARPVPKILLAALLAWLLATPAGAPASPTHGWVVRLSLALSGRSEPYTRSMLHRPQARRSAGSGHSTSTTVTPLHSS